VVVPHTKGEFRHSAPHHDPEWDDHNFPDDAEVPAGSELETNVNLSELSKPLKGYLCYFDIAPGKAVPEIKIFVPTRCYGRDDYALGQSLTQ
jgi:hypothetical protein